MVNQATQVALKLGLKYSIYSMWESYVASLTIVKRSENSLLLHPEIVHGPAN